MFAGEYKALRQQNREAGEFQIVPIRYGDRLKIMRWRNEQMYHLRQNALLTEENQEYYFREIVSNLFGQEQPGQILFSYLHGDQCIGYGGLVHINWHDKHAEISFIMDTELETAHFHEHWVRYLSLIEQVAFSELSLHKIFTYAYNIRPHLYPALEAAGFSHEAVLKDHCFFDGKFVDVLIHSKIKA